MRYSAPALCLVVSILLSSCGLHNASATERFRDSVFGLNDKTRWSRIDLAVEHVAPSYQQSFLMTRKTWGRDYKIADADLGQMEISPDREGAESVVTISWYSLKTMQLHQTTLQQTWQRADGHYKLVRENVIEGNPALLVPPTGSNPS